MGIRWKIDPTWTLFLDRDGVINERVFGSYVLKKEDFHFTKDCLVALKKAQGIFGRIVVVTNQQCVALELITEKELDDLNDFMIQEIQKVGGRIDKVYCATELKSAQAPRRKPSMNMGLEALSDFPEIDFKKSIMIGDTDSDLQFGMNLGMKTVLIESKEPTKLTPDMCVKSLNEWMLLL